MEPGIATLAGNGSHTHVPCHLTAGHFMLCSFNVASSGPYCSCGCTADFTELLRPRYRRPLAIGMSLMLFQQITGQPSVLYYAAKIFQAAGFAEAGEATGVALVLGFFKLVMTGVRERGSGDGEKEGGLVICCCCSSIAAVLLLLLLPPLPWW